MRLHIMSFNMFQPKTLNQPPQFDVLMFTFVPINLYIYIYIPVLFAPTDIYIYIYISLNHKPPH